MAILLVLITDNFGKPVKRIYQEVDKANWRPLSMTSCAELTTLVAKKRGRGFDWSCVFFIKMTCYRHVVGKSYQYLTLHFEPAVYLTNTRTYTFVFCWASAPPHPLFPVLLRFGGSKPYRWGLILPMATANRLNRKREQPWRGPELCNWN